MKKKLVLDCFNSLNETFKKGDNLDTILRNYLEEDIVVNISRPFDKTIGLAEHIDSFWKPLTESFSHIEIQPYIAMEGTSNGNEYVCIGGNFIGNFEKDWFRVSANGQPVWIRFHASFLIRKNKITKAWYFIDFLGVIEQAGYNLFPQKGANIIAPNPMTGDGIISYPCKTEDGEYAIKTVENMLEALCNYDGKNISSMGDLTQYWNETNMMWYGPSGIGTTKGLKGFQKNHQIPFLKAFPNRGILEDEGEDFFGMFGEGNYAVHFGFPAMYGTHTGDGWLQLKATGKSFQMRVMDFWRCENGLLKENWVLIDMVHTLEQLGVDIFELLAKQQQK